MLAKHSRPKGLLNPISISGAIDNPSVEVEYKGRQSNAILTTQVEKYFENIWRISVDTLVSNYLINGTVTPRG